MGIVCSVRAHKKLLKLSTFTITGLNGFCSTGVILKHSIIHLSAGNKVALVDDSLLGRAISVISVIYLKVHCVGFRRIY